MYNLDSPGKKAKEEAKMFLNEWKEFKNKRKKGINEKPHEIFNLGGGVVMSAQEYMAER